MTSLSVIPKKNYLQHTPKSEIIDGHPAKIDQISHSCKKVTIATSVAIHATDPSCW